MIKAKLQTIMIPLAVLVFVSGCATKPIVETVSANEGSSNAGGAQFEAQDSGTPTTATTPSDRSTDQSSSDGMVSDDQTSIQSANPFFSASQAQSALLQSARERVFFDLDSSALSGDAREILSAQAEFLRTYPSIQVIVEGNADERGTREYNLALGSRRAASVKDYLIALGVEPRRITTVSFGKERPIDNRANEAGWAMNRNARTLVIEID